MFKIAITRQALRRSLDHVCGIADKPRVLSASDTSSLVFMTAAGGKLELLTTNGEAEVLTSGACTVESEGKISVSAKIMQDIVQRLPGKKDKDDDLTVEIGPSKEASESSLMGLRAGRSQYRLLTAADAEGSREALAIDASDLSLSVSLEAERLKRLFDKVKFAIFADTSRPYLHGVHLHIVEREGGKYLRAVATDGHRLAYAEGQVENIPEGFPSGILPSRAVSEISRLMSDRAGSIKLSISETLLRVESEGLTMTSRLVEGDFPDYERIIPKDNETKAVINRRDLLGALDRVGLISNTVKFHFSSGDDGGAVTLEAQDNDTGNANEDLSAAYTSADMTLGFNGVYVRDILQQCESDLVEFAFGDPNGPVLIRDVDNGDMLFVLMPMRV